jgi:ATP-dependent DNA helicase PIF1
MMTPDPAAAAAREALAAKHPIVMLTGRAGTGKSYFVRELVKDDAALAQVVLAPTGLAAMNIGGQTVHSFFGFPPRPLIGLQEKPNWFFTKTARAVRRIIIDEVSMLRADVVDAMDQHLRAARKSVKPFGGVQMLLVGDFYQLPPVVRNDEQGLLADAGYESPYAFSSKALRDLGADVHELTEIRRQDDLEFIELLQLIRERRRVPDAVEELNARCYDQPPLGSAILLAATNAVADGYNRRGLEALPTPPKVFKGGFEGELPKNGVTNDRLPAPVDLVLKAGARVIFTQNDSEGRWVNGTLGRIEGFDGDIIRVRINGADDTVEVVKSSWPQARWVFDDKTNTMKAEETFRYVQYPLAPAWALTIHKAQGMTIEALEVDLGRGAFAPGQTYVALSRAKNLAGLRLTRPLKPSDVQVDPEIAQGLKRLSK